jgi:hypothetical protein
MKIACCLTESETVQNGPYTDPSQWHDTAINMSLSRDILCAQGEDKMNTQYFENNLKRLYQIRPDSLAQGRQENLKPPSEHKFPFSSLRSIARKDSV